jgi:phenylacetate-CoA ligase
VTAKSTLASELAPQWHSAVPGAVWPAIGTNASAHVQSLLFQLEQSQWLPPDRLRDWQLGQLKLVLRHALQTVPFYAEAFRRLDVDSLDWTAFAELPSLQRSTLQVKSDALSSSSSPVGHGKVTSTGTSGSTGMPVNVLGTAVTQLFWEALTLREHLWHQRDFGGKLAAIRATVDEARLPDWGPPAAGVFKTGPAATLYVSTDVARQLEWLQREDPDYLITHPTNLGALAELSIKRGVRLPKLRQARTAGEALRPELRATVRSAWNVDVTDTYSCSEAGVIALQCPLHEHYHVQSENLIVEVLRPDGKACRPGETGEVVLTTLHNFAMPLIRYRIGDYAELGEPCPCGRGLPVLKHIHGRQRNMLKTPDGKSYWPSFPGPLWQAVAPVEQFQLVQLELDRIEARYVMVRDLTSAEAAQLVAALQERLGFPFRIDLRKVGSIDRTAAHKFEDFISALPPSVNAND